MRRPVLYIVVLFILYAIYSPKTPNTSAPSSGTEVLNSGTTSQSSTQSSQPTKPTATPKPQLKITNDNWDVMMNDTAKAKGAEVVVMGRVFLQPEKDEKLVGFQMYAKGGEDGNTLVAAPPSTEVKRDDYVRVMGTFVDVSEGKNLFGATLRLPVVKATKVEKISREEAVAPAIKTIAVNQPINQHGLEVTLQQVELAKDETRFRLHLKNGATKKAYAFEHQAALVQGTQQLQRKSMLNEYPNLPSSILPGIEADVVLVYPAVKSDQPLKFIWEGVRTEDYNLKFENYTWNVNLN